MLHEEDRLRLGVDDATPGLHSVCILRHMLCVLVEIGDCGEDSGHGAGIVAVKACISLSLPINVILKDADEEAVRMLSVKARREQVCLVVSNASTLYTLQGTKCEPGLIYHWRFPARLDAQMRWLTVYMVLSRVPTLAQLRWVGLDAKVREFIDRGPLAGMLKRFCELFDENAPMNWQSRRCRSLAGETSSRCYRARTLLIKRYNDALLRTRSTTAMICALKCVVFVCVQ